jgi:hypothetical protein
MYAPPTCPARAQDSSRGQRPRKAPPSFPDPEGVELPWAAGRKTGVAPPGFDPCRVGRDGGCVFRGRCPRLLYRSPAGIKHGQCRGLSGGEKADGTPPGPWLAPTLPFMSATVKKLVATTSVFLVVGFWKDFGLEGYSSSTNPRQIAKRICRGYHYKCRGSSLRSE